MPRIIGLDFGTTNTRIHLGFTNAPERTSPLQPPNADRDALPSVILIDPTGELLEELGKPAVRALLDPARRDRVRFEFKPCLGRSEQDLEKQMESLVLELRCPTCEAKIPEGFTFCGKCGNKLPDDYQQTLAERALRYEREEAFGYAALLLAEVGKFLRRTTLGDSGWDAGDKIVIGVPVHWSEETRRQYAALVAKALGTDQVEPVDEPRAALAEYLWRAAGEVHAGDTVLVVDVGGGTTDLVAGVVQEDGTLGGDVRSHGIRYGGADFDDRVVLWALRQVELPDGVDEDQLAGALRPVCRSLKEELSDAIRRDPGNSSHRVEMPFTSRELYTDLALDRATFESEEVAGPLIGLFAEALTKGLAEMGLRAEDVAHVILVGGGSNAYFVEDVAKAILKNARVVAGQQPEVAISRGLVLVTAVQPMPTAKVVAAEDAMSGTAVTVETVLLVELDEPEPQTSTEPKPMDARFSEAIRYIRRLTERGKNRKDIEARLLEAGWTKDDFEAVWLLASKGSADENAASPPALVVTPTTATGLWGPAEPFPDIVELLEAGKWGEAKRIALDECDSRDPFGELVLFVRLLADVADRSYHLDDGQDLCSLADRVVSLQPRSGTARFLRSVARLLQSQYSGTAGGAIDDAEAAEAISPDAADGQFIETIVKGKRSGTRLLNDDGTVVEPPATVLGHLLLAAALQATDPRLPSDSTEGRAAKVLTMQRNVAGSACKDDPGLRVLERWQGTAVYPQLLNWLGNYEGGGRDVGRTAAYRRLVEALEQPPLGKVDLLAIARAEWLLAAMLPKAGQPDRVWSDRAAMTAWQYISEIDDRACVVMDNSRNHFVRLVKAGEKAPDVTRLANSKGGAVVRIDGRLKVEGTFALWRDFFTYEDVLIPFAWVRYVSVTSSTFTTKVTVCLQDGQKVLDAKGIYNVDATELEMRFGKWQKKWGDIAEGRRRPEREWLSTPSRQASSAIAVTHESAPVADQVYQCWVCEYSYHSADGDPDSGVAAGTAWADVPAKWSCSECGAPKARFSQVTQVESGAASRPTTSPASGGASRPVPPPPPPAHASGGATRTVPPPPPPPTEVPVSGGPLEPGLSDELTRAISDPDVPVLAYFWSSWSLPCQKMLPLVEAASRTYAGHLRVVCIEVGQRRDLAQRYEITTPLALKLFRGGRTVGSSTNALREAELRVMIEREL